MHISLKNMLRQLSHLVAPRSCYCCGRTLVSDENIMCMHCLMDLPRTGQHLKADTELLSRLCVLPERTHLGAGWFYYDKTSPYSRLIHAAKYYGRPYIMRVLGRMFGYELKQSRGSAISDAILLPIPLHAARRMLRGYNQSLELALGLSDILGCTVSENLVATRRRRPHALKNRTARLSDSEKLFRLENPHELNGRHLIIVDDIITTGATMLEAMTTVARDMRLTGTAPASINFLSLGITRNF